MCGTFHKSKLEQLNTECNYKTLRLKQREMKILTRTEPRTF